MVGRSSLPLGVLRHERGHGRAVVLDPDHPAVEVDRPPRFANLVTGTFPHLTRAEPGILEAIRSGS